MQDIYDILTDENGEKNISIQRNDKRKNKINVDSVEIKPIFKDDDDYIESPHPNLLRLPFSLLEIAPKGSGKSVLLQNLLFIYYKFFDNIFIFSPTIFLDDKWGRTIEKLKIPVTNLFTSYKESELTMLMEKIKEFNKGKRNKEKVRTLIIFDDIIEQLPKGKKLSAMNKLFMNHRHYLISHIVVSQSFKKVDNVGRMNTTGMILFRTDNKGERKKIVEELAGNYSYAEFEKMYVDATKEKFSFMFINYDNKKIFRKFEEQIGDLNKDPDYLYHRVKRQQEKY